MSSRRRRFVDIVSAMVITIALQKGRGFDWVGGVVAGAHDVALPVTAVVTSDELVELATLYIRSQPVTWRKP